MHPVSDEYKAAIYKLERMTRGRVTFDISDTTVEQDTIDTTVTSNFVVSDKKQLTDKKRENSYNIATWEPGRFKLDGSFSFADDNIINNKYIGWCSDQLCDATGVFNPAEVLTFSFNNPHSSMGITVTFDTLNNEYATDFIINAYDEFNNLIISEAISNNELAQVVVLGQFHLYRKVEVTINKWNKPYRRARVAEIDFGVVRVYTDSNLMKMALLEEMDIATRMLPSAEFMFTVKNVDREFNILNPEGFYRFLQERQRVTAEIGLVIGTATEYVELGNYYLMDWTSNEGSLSATFTARNILDIMIDYYYENLVAKENYTLHDMAVDVFGICGIANYEIDPELKTIYTSGLIKKADCRNVLQMIGVAGMCNIYVTREDKIILSRSPVIVNDIISKRGMKKEPKINLDSIVKSVAVTYYSDLDTQDIYIEENADVEKGENLRVKNNTLINTLVHAENVAKWILDRMKNRAIYTVNWRGNPAHDLNDAVIIEDSYNQNKEAIITKIDLEYQGYLSGTLEARGMIT